MKMIRPIVLLLRERSNDDPHLRSIDAVTGYHIHASDGEIGHVEDFLVEDTDWSIHYLRAISSHIKVDLSRCNIAILAVVRIPLSAGFSVAAGRWILPPPAS
jgi:hypothetical protein